MFAAERLFVYLNDVFRKTSDMAKKAEFPKAENVKTSESEIHVRGR